MRYTDPTGHHCVEDDFEGSCGAVERKMTKKYIAHSKRSDFEKKVLLNLLEAGSDGIHAAEYLLFNNVDFDNRISQPFGTGGGWQFDNSITFPDNAPLPSPDAAFTLSVVVHEVKHLEQGHSVALSAYGELEAWQTGFKMLKRLQGGMLSDTQQAILDLPLNHDPVNLITTVNLMEVDQQGGYLGGYLLYLTIPYFPVQPRP
jgi:hypothetical protein